MHSALNFARRRNAIAVAIIATGSLCRVASAAELMAPAQQNALVQTYCAVCHTDAAKNGGLSLEHFDAAQAPPSLTAMMLSKLTGGVRLQTAREAPTNESAAALVDKRMRSGAMGAAGIPIPDKATIDALIQAFAVESADATQWTVERSKDPDAPMITVSILQEMPSTVNTGEAEVYRLIASCDSAKQEGEMQLAWAPVARSGTLAASVDGNAAVQYRVEGSEKMGNGSGLVLHCLAALMLTESKGGVSGAGLPFPSESLTISDPPSGDTVTFSFAQLPADARKELYACFPNEESSGRLALSTSPKVSAER